MSRRSSWVGSRAGPWACRACLLVAVFVVFGRLLWCDFTLWDDDHTVYRNPKLNPGVTVASWVDFWSEPAASIYVPLTYSVWAALTFIARRPADAAGVTLDPAVYHGANVVVHALGALALFELLRRVARRPNPARAGATFDGVNSERASDPTNVASETSQSPRLWRESSDGQHPPQAWAFGGEPRERDDKNTSINALSSSVEAPSSSLADRSALPALMGALLWALHPLQVESVAWVSGLKDVLSGTLVIVALAAFIAFRQRERRFWFAVAVVAYAFALLAKPAAITGPLLLVLIDRFVLRTSWRRVAIGVAVFGVITVPIAVVARSAQPAPASAAPAAVRALLVGDTLAFYAVKTAAPIALTFDYGRDVATLRAGRELYVAWLVPVGIAALSAWAYRRARRRGRPLSPLPAVGMAVFTLAPLPVLGITRFDFQVISTTADHYAYVALIGVAMIAAWAVARWPRAWGALAAVVLVFGVRSAWQCRVWQDSESLFTHALVVNPRSWASHVNLSAVAITRHDEAAAATHLAAAEAIAPDQPSVQIARLADAARRGDRDAAYAAARRLIAAYDASWTKAGFPAAEAHRLIVKTFLDHGRPDAAAAFLEEGLRRDPNDEGLRAEGRRLGSLR